MTMLLSVRDLRASYGAFNVLHGLDFDIEQGSVTTLLGANGAGKTTTLRALCGMIKRSGTIEFDGKPINRVKTEDIVRLGIAHVPEGRGTFTTLSVEENLHLGAMTRPRGEVADDVDRVYALFPRLRERSGQQAGTLSGGEQQMLAIGRALMLKPRLMLLDEPSFGLAPLIVEELFGILDDIKTNMKVSMLLVEQNAALALDLADRAYLLETGTIAFSGSSAEIRDDEAIRNSYLGY
ncbi:MAG: ABC transporter ATP-binding protein [Brucellaceae bacterium]|nr:ABC transporter ATP-binding protein [Brucellaceae bacterium]MCO5058886.1 ABC transporter ATP-binding protein [Rhizobiaceae bacterium]